MGKTAELGNKSIGKLLAQYSIPAVIAMLVNAIYNVVDRIFIGQYAGEEALAALTIAFPVMMIIFAFASLIGAGGAALLSIRLGEKDARGASHVFGNTLSLGTLVSGATLIIIFINLDGLLGMFGATEDVMIYAMTYMSIILGGFIFQMISFTLNSSVRTEGQPILSMIAMIVSALTNIVLDYILIGIFNLGVAGAAYATIAGQFIGLMILLSFYIRGKSQIHLALNDLKLDLKVISQILTIGFATFISTIGTSIAMTFINRSLSEYGGTSAITAMGAINSLYTFFIMPIMGINQGMQPIIGYNHGANHQDRVSKTLKMGLGISIVFSSLVFVLLQVFPTAFVSMFMEEGSTTIAVAVNGLRIFTLMLPVLSINLIGTGYFQAIAKGKTSMVLGMLRQFVFMLPLLFVLPRMFGINGVWMATPIADGSAVVITIIIMLKSQKKTDQEDRWPEDVVLEG